MKTIKLEEHPLYIWLHKDKDYNAIHKLQNVLPSLKEHNLEPKENIILFNYLYYYLHSNFEKQVDTNGLLGKNLSGNNGMMKAFSYLQEVMPLDVNKKSVMWQDRYTGLMDQFKPMSDWFDREYPDYVKGKGFKKVGAEYTETILWKFAPTINCANPKIYHEMLELFDQRFARYNAKPNWHTLLNKKPSLFLGIYANRAGYELRHQELIAVFNSVASPRNSALQGVSKDDAYALGNMYAELLANSTYFKNSLAPTKRLDLTLQKFLDERPKENAFGTYDYFINAALDSKAYSMKKMVLELEKKNRVEVMGKSNLSKKEEKIYEEKKEELAAVMPKPRKLKI